MFTFELCIEAYMVFLTLHLFQRAFIKAKLDYVYYTVYVYNNTETAKSFLYLSIKVPFKRFKLFCHKIIQYFR